MSECEKDLKQVAKVIQPHFPVGAAVIIQASDYIAELELQLTELREELRGTQNAYHSLYKKLEKMSTSHHAAVYIAAKTALREIRNEGALGVHPHRA